MISKEAVCEASAETAPRGCAALCTARDADGQGQGKPHRAGYVRVLRADNAACDNRETPEDAVAMAKALSPYFVASP